MWGFVQEDFIFPVESGDTIDVTEVVARQHLLLALPIAPRCRDGCLGLCPTCGAERNEGECGCAMEDVGIPPERARWCVRRGAAQSGA